MSEPLELEPLGPIERLRPLPLPPMLAPPAAPARHYPPLSGHEISAAIADRLDELDHVLPQLEAERRQLRRMLEIAEEPITLDNVNGDSAPAGPQATPPSGADRPGAPPASSTADEPPPADDESDRPASDDSERGGGQDAPPPGRENQPASGSPGPAADEPDRPANAPGFADSVLAELRRQREPKTRRGLAVAMGLSPKVDAVRVGRALGQLVRDGQAEECGMFRSGQLYRAIPAASDASPATAATDDASAGDGEDESRRAQADASPLQQPDASSSTRTTAPISPRVRRELEREEAQRESKPPAGALEQRILDQLDAPLGPRALALAIGFAHPTEEMYSALRRLVSVGQVVQHRNGGTGIGEERHVFERTIA